jgi:hypothetical protein
LLGHMVTLFLIIWGISILVTLFLIIWGISILYSIVSVLIYIPPRVCKSSPFSLSLPTLVFFQTCNYLNTVHPILSKNVTLTKQIKMFSGNILLVLSCNPRTLEVETGGLRVQGQPGLHSETLVSKKKKKIWA